MGRSYCKGTILIKRYVEFMALLKKKTLWFIEMMENLLDLAKISMSLLNRILISIPKIMMILKEMKLYNY